MKKAVQPLLAFCCACLLLACSNNDDVVDEQIENRQRPVADYEVVPGDDPFTFTFNNKSQKFKSLEWRFGDDSLSYDDSPSHVYLRDGKYEVTLKATSEDGSTARKLIVVDINPEKILKITAVPEDGKVRLKADPLVDVTFTDATWDFGNGKNSDELSPLAEYVQDQLFTATVEATTPKGSVVKATKLVSAYGGLKDITFGYLLNVGPKFIASERVGARWGVVADWRVNTAVRQREGNMGGWDEWEGNSMSMESWGSEPDIVNGKIQQTTMEPLPAGQYYYQMKFHDFQVKDLLYNVVTKAGEIPDIENVDKDANVLGLTKFMGNEPLTQTTGFKLDQSGKVTIGFVSTFLQSDQNFKLTQVRLYKLDN